MNKLRLLFLSFFILALISPQALFGAVAGDYQSAGSGVWTSITTWQKYDGSNWVATTTIPDSTSSSAVTILSPNNVTVDSAIRVRNLTINLGATLTVNGVTAGSDTVVLLHYIWRYDDS